MSFAWLRPLRSFKTSPMSQHLQQDLCLQHVEGWTKPGSTNPESIFRSPCVLSLATSKRRKPCKFNFVFCSSCTSKLRKTAQNWRLGRLWFWWARWTWRCFGIRCDASATVLTECNVFIVCSLFIMARWRIHSRQTVFWLTRPPHVSDFNSLWNWPMRMLIRFEILGECWPCMHRSAWLVS